MIAIDNTLVSEDLIEKKFVCDLSACKGACCVHGESGAPLEEEETKILKKIYSKVKPYMVENGIKAIEKQGHFIIDSDGDFVTPLVGEEGECAYVFFDAEGVAKCAIEQAYLDKKIDWQKPISCHLYPVRVTKYKTYEAVNYHKWKICKPACECGEKLSVPVYKFVKKSLIKKFGASWYKKLEIAADNFIANK
ncbi:MAG: DUF3109 family protein [Bacteroidota bacterium]|jgi:hypothetical protein